MLEAHQLIIFKVCNAYCHDKEEQKDLVQEVILQLWNSFEKYDPQYKYSTWVYRIALNVAISHYRKSRTRGQYIGTFEASFVNIAEEKTEDNSAGIEQLEQFINELDELNRALMLLYLEGKSHDEIASILNISKSNVGTKINRIKEKLKQQFKQHNTHGTR